MPVNLPNLYAKPADVFDYMGIPAVQFRLDDNNDATGQTITVTANAVAGATSINCAALASPLIKGTVLEFTGGGMAAAVEAVLSATALLGATTLAVTALLGAVSSLATAQDSGVNYALAQRLVKACQYATGQVKLYCCGRYNDSDLVNSWSVNRWATALAARWIGRRVCRPCPQSILDDADEALKEMKQVRVSALSIEDIGTRTSGWPFITNVTHPVGLDVAQVRVEPQISEGTPTQYSQYIDWNSALIFEW